MEDRWYMKTDTVKLSDLKAGDEVARAWDPFSNYEIVIIEAIIDGKIVIEGAKYDVESGMEEVPPEAACSYILVATEYIRTKMERRTLFSQIQEDPKWRKLPLEALRQIKAILDANPV